MPSPNGIAGIGDCGSVISAPRSIKLVFQPRKWVSRSIAFINFVWELLLVKLFWPKKLIANKAEIGRSLNI